MNKKNLTVKSYHYNKQGKCPHCGALHDGGTVATFEKKKRKAAKGDIGVCTNCAGIYQLVNDWDERKKITIEEIEELISPEQFELFRIVLSYAQLKSQEKKNIN